MKSILNHKMHSTTKVSIMALILLLSIATPLLVLPASAASTVSLSPSSGPNGTTVTVSGNGFGTSDAAGSLTITVNGLSTKIQSNNVFTNTSGVFGTFIIGGAGSFNLVPGTYAVQISDSVAAPPAVSFTITQPTVTVTPSTGPAGTSVYVTGSGFSTQTGNTIIAAAFANTPIAVSAGTVTALYSTLSSKSLSKGAYTGTVSLPMITAGSTFSLLDNWGNNATTTFALNTPTVTLSPMSGQIGTVVTATVAGFGPGASISSVKIGNGAAGTLTTLSPLVPTTPMVTEQGTSAFIFQVGATPLTANFAAGAQAIIVTDSNGNTATASFTITPTVTLTLGQGAINSGVSAAPTGATNVVAFLSASGFKPNTLLTVSASPNTPLGWVTYVASGGYPSLTTDANGAIGLYSTFASPVVSGTGTAPPSGIYSVTVSDGTTTVTVLLQITSSASFFTISPTSGASGTTVTLTGFGATTTAISFDYTAVGTATQCVGNAWPNPPTTPGMFTVPPSGAGSHVVTTTGISGSAAFINTGAPAITVVSPSTAAVGTMVTIIGSGYAKASGVTLAAFTIDGITVPATAVFNTFMAGSMVTTFNVPAFLPGVHIISASDSFFNTATASLTTTVSSIAVAPTSGVVATSTAVTLQLTGSGFPMGQAITVMFDSTTLPAATVGLSTTNTNGGIIIYTTTIPASTLTTAGAHTITLVAGTAAATATFTVTPTITLSVGALRAPSTVTITGAGFSGSSALTVSLNGTATTWYNTGTFANTTTVTSDTSGNVPGASAVIIVATTASGTLNITVTDALGFAASKTLTVLAIPSITLGATQGISGTGSVGIAGAGFTPGSRVASVNFLSGTTVLFSGIQNTSPMTVGSSGTFLNTVESFNVPSVPAGTYTVNLTLTSPTESAVATFVILGAPIMTTSVTSAAVGTNVTITVVGLTNVATATLGGTLSNLLATPGTTFGSQTPLTTGANAYNLTTWFIVPSLPAGPYTLLLSDTGGIREAQLTFSVTTSMSLSPTTGILKGTIVYITGSGFATAGTAFNVTVNGALMPSAAGTTGAGGTVSTSFTVPLTATVASNTVVVMDASGNTGTATFKLTAPAITLTPASGTVGSTVQIIGSGFTPYSAIVIEVGSQIVNFIPSTATPNSAGAFIAYIMVPAGLSGNQTITVIDSSNNVATATFAITTGGATGFTLDQATLSATSQTLNSAGQPAASFARGSSVKLSFVLDSTAGSGSIVWRVTLQQGTAVYNIATTTAAISTTPTTLTFTQLIPTTVSPGTWTASIQIFASDGVTPLGVATLTFSVT